MNPAHVEAGRSIKNAAVNNPIVHSKKPKPYGKNLLQVIQKQSTGAIKHCYAVFYLFS